jgi:hypothetical protein
MKTFSKFVAVGCMIFQFSAVTLAQVDDSSRTGIFNKGDWELNFSAGIGDLTSSSKSSSTSTYGSYTNDNSESWFFLQLGIIPAYFITEGLSIEPEINLLIQKEEDKESQTASSFLANLSYTFNIPDKNFAPFIRIGYGISNSLQFPTTLGDLMKISEDFDVTILNAGAGLKVLLSPSVIFRTEINYRRHSYNRESSNGGYNFSSENTLSSITGIFGFSILL